MFCRDGSSGYWKVRIFLALIVSQMGAWNLSNAFAVEPVRRALGDEENAAVEVFNRGYRFVGVGPSIYCELEAVRPGELRHATLNIYNKGDEEVELLSTKVLGALTQADVPNVVLRKDDVAKCQFSFQVPERPRVLKETFIVVIETKGACKEIRVRFTAEYYDLLMFSQTSHIASFSADSLVETVKLPIVTSDPALLSKVRFEGSDAMRHVLPEFIKEKDLHYVTFRLSPHSFPGDDYKGELRMILNDKVASAIQCNFRRKLPVEIFPSTPIFVPGLDGKTLREAHFVLKIREQTGVQVNGLRDVECEATDGTPLFVNHHQINDGVFRMRVEIDDRETLEAIDIKDKLVLKVRLGNGESYSLPFPFAFSN